MVYGVRVGRLVLEQLLLHEVDDEDTYLALVKSLMIGLEDLRE